MHYNTFPAIKADPAVFELHVKETAQGTDVVIMQPGETLDF